MNPEIKNCQNCKQDFTIESEDFSFYEKIKVPPPTFCFDCRVQRRMTFRNERVLYRRRCDAPGHTEKMLSVFTPESKQKVFCHGAWWGDGWDAMEYGRDIDFSRPFLEQVRELWADVPDIALLNINPVNSEYCSITEGNKNCYLVFGGDFNQDTLYSTYIFRSRDSMDTYWVQNSELNYETVDCSSCTKLSWSRYCEGCYDSAFLFNCKGCHDCFGCVNLSNKSYCIFNEQYSKEEYFKKMSEIDLSDHAVVEEMKQKFATHMVNYPRRFAKLLRSTHSSGDNLENCKDCKHCFDMFEGAENCAYSFLAYSQVKDSFDVDHVGLGTELVCDSSTVYPGHRVFFSRFIFGGRNVQYSYHTHNSNDIFGCVGLRNKQFCILNKQYTKEEYETLVPKIIQHMKDKPYVDAKGREHSFGEFFPVEMSPFAYNETLAQEMFPLSGEAAEHGGYKWRKKEVKEYIPTKSASDLPPRIDRVDDSILSEIIECAHKGTCNDLCSSAFKIVPAELAFYRNRNIPLPHLCSNCRHYRRLEQRNPMRTWHRTCQCSGAKSSNNVYQNTATHIHGTEPCTTEFETSYAPDRPEIVYCEKCYQQEVV